MYVYKAIIRSVYDGDTIRADLSLGFGIVDHGSDGKGRQFRLHGINTPEVRGKEREEGLKVRDYLRSLIPEGTEVMILSIKDKSGKYGRYLCDLYLLDGTFINQHLLDKGMAVEYMK